MKRPAVAFGVTLPRLWSWRGRAGVSPLPEKRSLRVYRDSLRALLREAPRNVAMPVLHIGHAGHLHDDDAPFPLHAALCIASVAQHHPETLHLLHAPCLPSGPAWDMVKHLVRFIPLPALTEYRGAPVLGRLHLLEIARLVALEAVGGAFLASDSMVLANLTPLADMDFGMVLQQAIPGARPRVGQHLFVARTGSSFAAQWLAAYADFPKDGTEITRRAFSTELPLRLYGRMPEGAHIIQHEAAALPLWSNAHRFLFAPGRAEDGLAALDGQYVLPLWGDVVGPDLRAWAWGKDAEEQSLFSLLAERTLRHLQGSNIPSDTVATGAE